MITLHNLQDFPQNLETLARWHQDEWSHLNPGESLGHRIKRMQTYLNDDFIPGTFIAVDDQLLGSATIVATDMDNKPGLTPWLASVYVKPDSRRQGVGSRLVRHVMTLAKREGLSTLYLFTPDHRSFYQQLGWTIMGEEVYRSHKVSVMKTVL